MQLLLLFLLFFRMCYGDMNEIQDCGSHVVITDVRLSNVEITEACIVAKRDTIISFEVDFIPKKVSKSLIPVVSAMLGKTKIRFPLKITDVCMVAEESKINCPLQVDVANTYNATFAVRQNQPPLTAPVTWELKDEDNTEILCISYIACIK